MKEPIIQIKGLTQVYQTKPDVPPIYALKNIDLQIEKGEIYGIIGMSGAGKSTLIRCLTGLEKPTEGSIWIAHQDFTQLNGKELRAARKNIGMIFQHFNLFSSKTALENVLYPLEISKITSADRGYELLEIVGLKGKEHFYPAQLSGGEKQRVAIARALANKPKVLLCDEATSALDPKTRDSILELLSELNQKFHLTIVLITHEMEVVKKICTELAVLEHGELVEKGKVSDVFYSPKHATTKHFLQNMVHEFPEHLVTQGKNSELLRVSFRGKSSKEPIISKLIKKFSVDVNILLGNIDVLKTETVGNLIVELTGPLEERQKAKLFLKEHGVDTDERL